MKVIYVRRIMFLTSLPASFQADQTALLKENADLLVSMRGAIFFDARKRGVDQVLISMGEGKYWYITEQPYQVYIF